MNMSLTRCFLIVGIVQLQKFQLHILDNLYGPKYQIQPIGCDESSIEIWIDSMSYVRNTQGGRSPLW